MEPGWSLPLGNTHHESPLFLVAAPPKSAVEIVYGSGRITDKEEINTQYTCIYRVTRVAQKQVCRDVLKYKEVERSRDVTAYRPVTKYKTERQCD